MKVQSGLRLTGIRRTDLLYEVVRLKAVSLDFLITGAS